MAGQAKPSSSSSGSSPLLKISGERTSLLHEDELTPKNSSESGSLSGDKVTIISDLSPGILSVVALSDLHPGPSSAAGSQKCCRTRDNLHLYVFVCKIK